MQNYRYSGFLLLYYRTIALHGGQQLMNGKRKSCMLGLMLTDIGEQFLVHVYVFKKCFMCYTMFEINFDKWYVLVCK